MNDPGVTRPGRPSPEADANGSSTATGYRENVRPSGSGAPGAGRNPGPDVIVPAVTGLALSAVASGAASAVPGTFLKAVVWLAVAVVGLAVMSVARTVAARREPGSEDQAPPGPGR